MSKCVYRSLPDMSKARNRVDGPLFFEGEKKIPAEIGAYAKGRRFFIRTYGCQANIRDEEIMAGYLASAGFSRTENESEADLAIINTCAVRENAEDKVYGQIGVFKANADRNPSFILAVCGCMMQEEGVAEKLTKTYPYLSLVFGTHNVSDILSLLNEVIVSRKRLVDVKSFPGAIIEGMPSVRLDGYKAFVNISYGCDKFCTYCIVPYTRGRERSRRPEAILKECEDLAERGFKQVTLLGQNVNSYGLDFKDGTTFASLLDQVAGLDIPHVRFLTSYPSQFTDAMIDVMARHPNIDKWLHLPVQSGSDSCLKRMGRRYTREGYLDLVRRIRAKIPSIALTTDLIVGFPNETAAEFEDTLSLCREVSYSSAFMFIYSPRRGTPAAAIKDGVGSEEKHARFLRLSRVIEETTSKHSLSMVGGTYSVLVDGPSKKDPSVLSGYAPNGKLVNFKGPLYLKGAEVPVKIKESHTYSLIGEMVGEAIVHKAEDVAYLLRRDPLAKEYLRLDEAVRGDPEIKKLGEDLVSAKKAMALSMGRSEEYEAAKKTYEGLLRKIKNHPLLANRAALQGAVEDILLQVRDSLK
ncbi:MAG: tRNA (N6-isopentenyl adenosine(37)-C2)-methylthiotransferase MiaB [Bacilli bacterium]|nr:tRNA (N6-isopentenyl adenosine(37)-C2)-methylthiotransferase MiaB [Bacilli bacterium]